jgi:hypothetical protein
MSLGLMAERLNATGVGGTCRNWNQLREVVSNGGGWEYIFG